MKNYILIRLAGIFLLGHFAHAAIAQETERCGAQPSKIDRKVFEAVQRGEIPEQVSDYTLRLFVHILRDDDGNNPAASVDNVLEAVEILKNDFRNTGICFGLVGIDFVNNTLCNQNFVDDYFFGIPGMPIGVGLLNIGNRRFDCMNVYVTHRITSSDGTTLNGVAIDIPESVLAIRTGRLRTSTLAHEMGHCLGPLHTHNIEGTGFELVDRVNCTEAGDLLCDTPADPDLSKDDMLDGCNYVGTTLDLAGKPYQPMVQNFMSYALNCRDTFTPGQASIMRYWCASGFWYKIRAEYWLTVSGTPGNDIVWTTPETWLAQGIVEAGNLLGGDFTVAGDIPASFVADFSVELFPGFSAQPAGNGFVQAYINVCDSRLPSSRKPEDAQFIEERSVKSNDPALLISIAPNPFTTATTIAYLLAEDAPVTIRVFNATGSLVATPVPAQQQPAGEHSCVFEAGQLPPGVYTLVVQAGDRRATKRLVLTR